MFELYWNAFATVLLPQNILAICMGGLWGLLAGALPGISTSMGVVLLLVYIVFYAGFMALSAFRPAAMADLWVLLREYRGRPALGACAAKCAPRFFMSCADNDDDMPSMTGFFRSVLLLKSAICRTM